MTDCLKDQSTDVLSCPSQSPDINPTKIMEKQIRHKNFTYLNELITRDQFKKFKGI